MKVLLINRDAITSGNLRAFCSRVKRSESKSSVVTDCELLLAVSGGLSTSWKGFQSGKPDWTRPRFTTLDIGLATGLVALAMLINRNNIEIPRFKHETNNDPLPDLPQVDVRTFLLDLNSLVAEIAATEVNEIVSFDPYLNYFKEIYNNRRLYPMMDEVIGYLLSELEDLKDTWDKREACQDS